MFHDIERGKYIEIQREIAQIYNTCIINDLIKGFYIPYMDNPGLKVSSSTRCKYIGWFPIKFQVILYNCLLLSYGQFVYSMPVLGYFLPLQMLHTKIGKDLIFKLTMEDGRQMTQANAGGLENCLGFFFIKK